MPDINKSSLNIELSPRTVWTVDWSWSSGRSTLPEDEEGFDMIIDSLLDVVWGGQLTLSLCPSVQSRDSAPTSSRILMTIIWSLQRVEISVWTAGLDNWRLNLFDQIEYQQISFPMITCGLWFRVRFQSGSEETRLLSRRTCWYVQWYWSWLGSLYLYFLSRKQQKLSPHWSV